MFFQYSGEGWWAIPVKAAVDKGQREGEKDDS